MKLLAIRGSNLASLAGEFEVKLNEHPLSRAGLFAITGSTGAGKSTLLDALCLALFDRMPRMPGGYAGRVGRFGDPDELCLPNNDVRLILRRGSGFGFAEVDFLGKDGAAYRVRWEVRRARSRAEGRFQRQTMSLVALDENRSLSGLGKSEVLDAVQERLGLNFDQFRRSVLLAQGDFAAFLRAPASERAQLLEMITGTALYGKLSIAAFRRAEREAEALRRFSERLADLKTLSPEERDILIQEIVQSDAAIVVAEAAHRTAEDDFRRLMEDQRLEKDCMAAGAALAQAQAALEEAAARRRELEATRRALPARPWLREWDGAQAEASVAESASVRTVGAAVEAQAQAESAAVQEKAAESRRTEAEAAILDAEPALERAAALDEQIKLRQEARARAESDGEKARKMVDALETQWRRQDQQRRKLVEQRRALEEWLTLRSAFQPVVEQWPRWNATLARFIDAQHNVRDATTRLGGLDQESALLETTRPQLDHEAEAARLAMDHAQQEMNALRRDAGPSHAALHRHRVAVEASLGGVQDMARSVEESLRLARDQEQAMVAVAAQRAVAAEAGARAEALKVRLRDGMAALAEAQSTLDQMKLALGRNVTTLRAQLHAGAPCPVCGSTEHPWVGGADDTLTAVFETQERRVETLRNEQEAQTHQCGRSEADAATALKQVEIHEKILCGIEKSRVDLATAWGRQCARRFTLLEETEQSAQEIPVFCGGGEFFSLLFAPESFPEAPWDVCASSRTAAEREALKARLETVRIIEKAAIEQAQALEQARKRERQANDRLNHAERKRAEQAQRLEALKSERSRVRDHGERAERSCREASEELDAPFDGVPEWRSALERDATEFRQQLLKEVESWSSNQKTLNELTGALADIDQKAATLAAQREAAVVNARNAETLLADAVGVLAEAQAQRRQTLEGRPVAEVRRVLLERRREAEKLWEAHRKRHQVLAQALAAAIQARDGAAVELERRRRLKIEAREALDRELATRGLEEVETRRRLARDDAWLVAEERALAALDEAHKAAEVRLSERRLRWDLHRAAGIPERSLDQTQEARDAAQRDVVQHREKLTLLKARQSVDDQALRQKQALAAEHAQQARRNELWQSMKELIGSAKGDKFRNFAQSLSLDVLLGHANTHLAELSRRYRLERAPGSDMDLQVIDRDFGDEARSVHSLSGGETFLASLALALGLSSMTGGRARIETLFIDEGFGALDPETLDVALSCLEALQATGRQIGVVSHIPALVERINTQIHVQIMGGGRSKVIVRG
ncbi:DNA repair protein SbcC/Rad50 [Azospirillaceae bacterium]